MTKRNRRLVKDVKDEHKAQSGRIIREKFEESRKIPRIVAKSDRQRQALSLIEDKQMMILCGSSGSGKTEIACWYAAKEWLAGRASNIIITRPMKSMNGDDAAIPGNDFQKTLPYTMAILLKFKKYLGSGILRNNLRQEMEDILFNEVSGLNVFSMEKLNGLSFDSKTIIICDEAQSSTVGQMKSLVTRCELGAKLLICGDLYQSAIKGKNGLQYLMETVEAHPNNDIGVVKFLPEDCCRVGISAYFTKLFEEEGIWSDK